MAYAGWLDGLDSSTHENDTEVAIRADPRLTLEKKQALLAVYRSLVTETAVAEPDPPSELDAPPPHED